MYADHSNNRTLTFENASMDQFLTMRSPFELLMQVRNSLAYTVMITAIRQQMSYDFYSSSTYLCHSQ